MSARKTIYVNLHADCDPGESPNRYVGRITADLRLHFPPHIDPAEVRAVATDAVTRMWQRVDEWQAERERA